MAAAGRSIRQGRQLHLLRVNRRSHDLLAGAGVAAHEHRNPRARDFRQDGQLPLERGRDGLQRLRGSGGRVQIANGSGGSAQDQERAPTLDDVAVGKRGPVDAASVHAGTVLRSGVLESPVVTGASQPHVQLRGRPIGQIDAQAGPAAREASLGAAADFGFSHAREREASRRRTELGAVERQRERPLGSALARTRGVRPDRIRAIGHCVPSRLAGAMISPPLARRSCARAVDPVHRWCTGHPSQVRGSPPVEPGMPVA